MRVLEFCTRLLEKRKGVSKMAEQKQYDKEYKVQAVKPVKEIGTVRASEELGVPKNTCMAG